MPTPALSLELKREAVEAVEQYGSQHAAADALGISRSTLQSRYRQGIAAAARGEFGTKPVIPGFEITQVTQTPNGGEFIQQRPASGEEFEVPNGHHVKGVSALVDQNGRTLAKWIKTREDQVSIEDVVEVIKKTFEDWEPPKIEFFDDLGVTDPIEFANANYDGMRYDPSLATIYPIADWHVGLLAWNKETGQDWDLPIAKDVIQKAMTRLVEASPAAEQGVVLGLGDLLHSDGYENMTARSKNLLDVDGRWPKVLRTATELLIYTIELALHRHKKVLVRVLPGNHDEESAIAVSLALWLYYKDHPRVTVDDDPSRFWWWSFGNTLLGATHGDKAKMEQLPLLMAIKNPEAWGHSKFRSIYTGHIHTDTSKEYGGVKVESFQTPVAPDAWHSSMGYNAGRAVSSITIHKDAGEIARSRVNIVTS